MPFVVGQKVQISKQFGAFGFYFFQKIPIFVILNSNSNLYDLDANPLDSYS